MPSPTRRRIFLGGVTVLMLAAGFVAADYFGLFGTSEHVSAEYVEFRVKTFDAETGRPVPGVRVTCFQYGTNNACGQPASRERGVVRINLRMKKHERRSLLFTHDSWYAPVTERELRIMYIHPEYKKPVQRFDITELVDKPGRTFTVTMEPLMTAGEGRDTDE